MNQAALEHPQDHEQWILMTREVLKDVLDPCSCLAGSPMNICDLGLVQDVSLIPATDGTDQPTLSVRLALTDPMCMYFIDMAEEIRQSIGQTGWRGMVNVEWDTSVDWSPSMMSAAGQLQIVEVKQQRFAQLRPYDFRDHPGNDSDHHHDS